ncbi:MAG: hypothetical protein IT306_05310 [Chloroflexi bacterium]|nr:hypothetical protein [Chloroflexota bacterium]
MSPTSGLVTTEGGSTATFTVRLALVPSSDVTVGVSSSNTTEGTVSPSTLTLTLSAPTNAVISQGSATGTIQNRAVPSCSPRPAVTVSQRVSDGKLLVHVATSALNSNQANPLNELRFGALRNVRVALNGQPVASGQNVSLPPGAAAVDFTVERVTPGQATIVPFTVVDGCGSWSTFVGGGASAGF